MIHQYFLSVFHIWIVLVYKSILHGKNSNTYVNMGVIISKKHDDAGMRMLVNIFLSNPEKFFGITIYLIG